MAGKTTTKTNLLIDKIVKVISAGWFLWVIIGLFMLQALWIALSFRFPMVYDEKFHFGVIQIFSHKFSPLIFHQPPEYDMYGNLSFGNASIYHYLMSFPYRLITLGTNSEMVAVVFLRLLNIGMAAVGVFLFARVFRLIGIKQGYINIGLLVYILLPLTTLVAATISYDNMLLPLTAWFLLVAVRILKEKEISWIDIALIVLISILASLVKFTFLPVALVGILYITVVLVRRYGKNIWGGVLKSIKQTSTFFNVLILTVFALLIFLFSARYIVSVVQYGSPLPKCTQTMEENRCRVNPVVGMEELAVATKDQRQAVPLDQYIEQWTQTIVHGFAITAANTTLGKTAITRSPSIFSTVLSLGIFLGTGVLIYAWRSMKKNQSWYFLLTMAICLSVATFLFNMQSYYAVHASINIQPRYLLSILPILIVMSVVATGFVVRRTKFMKAALFLLFFVLCTQGAGVITHISGSDSTWYWQKSPVLKTNEVVKKVVNKMVIGR